MLNKLLGKKPTFYLELKETEGDKSAPAKTEAPAPVVEAPAPVAEAPAPVAEVPAATEKKSKKTSVKKEKKEKTVQKVETPAAPVAPAATNGKVEPTEVEFATKYLIVPPASRRRPGPSLNPFKDMARKAKLPNR
jgi:hypothetical protein